MSEQPPGGDVAALVGKLGHEMSTLVSKEMELARTELRDELSKGAKAGVSLSGAAVTGLIGLLFVSAAAAWGLAEVMAEGFAFLIVGAAYLTIGAVLAAIGRRRLADVDPVPRHTLETLKEDAEWAKTVKKS